MIVEFRTLPVESIVVAQTRFASHQAKRQDTNHWLCYRTACTGCKVLAEAYSRQVAR